MSITAPGEQTVVARLRLSGIVADPLLAKLRMATALNSAQLAPAGLPPAAIVIVRHLRDPLPGRMLLQQPGGMAPLAWQQAVQQKIASLARQAARPARGCVASAAAAVWFLDRSELLACLARDWIEGTAALHWWWQALLRRQDIAGAVLGEWLQHPQQVPAALQQLAQNGHAVRFVMQLTESDARRMLAALLQVFGLSALQALLANFPNASAARQLVPSGSGAALEVRGAEANLAYPGAWPPWQQQVPECATQTMTLPRHCLLGIALMLIRKPSAVAKSDFAQAVQQWLVATPSVAPHNEAPEVGGIEAGKQNANAGAGESQTLASGLGAEKLAPVIAAAAPGAPHESRGEAIKQSARPNPLEPEAAQQNDSAVPNAGLARHETTLSPLRRVGEDVAIMQSLATIPNIEPARVEAASSHLGVIGEDNGVAAAQFLADGMLETEFGGLFYLINLGLFLGLYGDFTSPARPGIALPIWDFVALLGEGLAGKHIRRDPLWNLLACLAGRHAGEQPGHDYAPPDSWRIPDDWLLPFAHRRGSWRWQADAERLRVEHPTGFCVLDIARNDSPAVMQVQHEMGAYRNCLRARLSKSQGGSEAIGSTGSVRWMERVMPYVRRRLALGLGMRDARRAARLLLRQPARIALSAAHLDVHFQLAQLPIAVRLAGLDRDPGWVPAAGRVIAFHYE